ncbi:MAG: hypothetical protein R3D30_12065 [Hyphomicrobiales bacterium]
MTRGTLVELAGVADALKGEIVIVVAPPSTEETEVTDARILADLKQALKTQSFRDAGDADRRLKVKRARVYELGLGLTRSRD